ncbi:glycosyl transferase family 1 [Herbaspirillum rubrisubalbicans]|nr:glycosyl transferase family 1 [Herbaspirillum rubrisubalbicans]
MRVAMNGTALLSPLTGIGQYTFHLAQGLAARSDVDLNLFYAAMWSREVRQRPLPSIGPIKTLIKRMVPFAYELHHAISQSKFTAGVRSFSSDVYHEPNFLAFKCDRPSVITVHDLSWLRFPHTHPKERVRAMDRYFEPGLRRASVILTDSEFVRGEVLDVFGLPAERVITVPLGVEGLFHPRAEEQCRAVLSAQSLQYGQYLLAVGTLEPRKNLSMALEAFSRLPAALRKRNPLVLAGMKGWHTSAMERQMAPMVAAGEVRVLGYLARDELATITAGARAMVYPSIYEGFGLPPLEAMACRVPTIVSNVSSLPEVVGDTGLLIDSQDVDGATEAMLRLLEDDALREEQADKALARSAGFSWERCVEGTLDGYRRALS